jgi:hypothetical protein
VTSGAQALAWVIVLASEEHLSFALPAPQISSTSASAPESRLVSIFLSLFYFRLIEVVIMATKAANKRVSFGGFALGYGD